MGVRRAKPLDLVAVNEDKGERAQNDAPKEHTYPTDAIEPIERHDANVFHQHENHQGHKELQAHHQVVHILPRQAIDDMVGHDTRQFDAAKDDSEHDGQKGREIIARRHFHHHRGEALEGPPKLQDAEKEVGDRQNRHEGGVQADDVAQHHA